MPQLTAEQLAQWQRDNAPTIQEALQMDWEGSMTTACSHDYPIEIDNHCPKCGAPSWAAWMGVF